MQTLFDAARALPFVTVVALLGGGSSARAQAPQWPVDGVRAGTGDYIAAPAFVAVAVASRLLSPPSAWARHGHPSNIAADSHWTSDVLVGVAIGSAIRLYVPLARLRGHREPLTPVVGTDSLGLAGRF